MQKLEPKYRPSNSWYAAAGHSNSMPVDTAATDAASPLPRNAGSTNRPPASSSTATENISPAHSAMTALPRRAAQSRWPAPMAWPTRVVPAVAMPMVGM